MNFTYRVEFWSHGRKLTDYVTAGSQFEAIRLIKERYPEATAITAYKQ